MGILEAKKNLYRVILEGGTFYDIEAPGFVVDRGRLVFPAWFNRHSDLVSEPGTPVAAFAIDKVAGLTAHPERDASLESGWDEIGGMRSVSVGELSQQEQARQQAVREDQDRRWNEGLKKLRESQAALDALRSENLQVATKTPAIAWPEHAGWRAQDSDGQVRFFEVAPWPDENSDGSGQWTVNAGDTWRGYGVAPDWKQSLIKRPD